MEFPASKEGYLSVPGSSELDFEEEFTLEAWVRPSSEENFYAPVLGKTTGGGGGEKTFSYYLYAGDYEHHPFGEVENPLGSGRSVTAPEAIAPTAWTHLALTFDGAKERLYVNGALVDETTAPAPVTTTGELEIGAETEHGDHFHGRIDEVRIYDRALDAAEVGADMEAPLQTQRSGPVAEYSFDEGSEESVTDLSGHGHTATIEAATVAPGRYGRGLAFDGKEDCVQVPVDEELQATEEFTLEAWVRPEGSGEESLPVIAMDDENSGPGEEQFSYELFGGQDEAPKGWVRKAGESGTWNVYGEEPLPEKSWSHLTLTDDGHVIRLYVDGKLGNEENSTDVAPPLTEAEGPLTIGCGIKYGAYRYFKGRIDEVRVYDRALDAGEVAADTEAPIQTPKQGPVAAYSFDEGSGSTVEDTTSDGHTATIEGATWTTHGKYGGALAFNGTSSCVKVPVDEELQATEEFTLEAWVRPEGSGAEALPVIAMDDEGSVPEEEQFSYELFGGNDDTPKGWVRKYKEGGTWNVYGEEPLPEKAWSHLTLTDDGHVIRLYVDGILGKEENSTDVAPPLTEAEGPLTIGCGIQYGAYRYFKGRIDEVRVYDRALDAGEVQADTETPLQTPKQGPVAEYSFDEGTGTTAEDLTGDGHTATIEGAEWTTHGKYGGALQFNGTSSCLSIADAEDLRLGEEFTLESWIRPEGVSKRPVIYKEATEGFPSYSLGIGFNTYGLPEGQLGKEGKTHQDVAGTGEIPQGAWSDLALTYDGARLRLYVNGELVATKAVEKTDSGAAGPLKIGCSKLIGSYFKGRIDEVRIYNRAMTAGEVDADMETPIQTPRKGPVAAYGFDEGEGTTAEDLTGDGHTATIEGAEWTTHGKYGGALQFNGASSCLSVADSEELRMGEEFTLEAWVRPEGELKKDPIIFKEGSSYLNYALDIGHDTTGRPEGSIGVTASPHHKEVAAGEAIPANAWTHLATTFDGSKERLYVNGDLVATKAVEGASSGREGALKIGCDSQYGEHFHGRIDEVRIYNRALAAAEVATDDDTAVPPLTILTSAEYEDEEEDLTQATLSIVWPDSQSGPGHTVPTEPRLDMSSVTYGSTKLLTTRTFPDVEIQGRPYSFNWCPKIPKAGTHVPLPSDPHFGAYVHQIIEEGVEYEGCHGPGVGEVVNQFFVDIHGRFSYKVGQEVWVEKEPKCIAYGGGINNEVDAPVLERCYNVEGKGEDGAVKAYGENGRVNVEEDLVWIPGQKFEGAFPPSQNACVKFNGVLSTHPPERRRIGLVLNNTKHAYEFHSGLNGDGDALKCHYQHPQEIVAKLF